MLDPASIVTICGVTVKLCTSIVPAVLDFRNFLEGAKHVDAAISALLREIKDFKNILETLKSTAEDPEVRVLIEASGNTGEQWYRLKLSLDDAKTTLRSLEETVTQRVNKDVVVLDKERKKIRLNGARDEIMTYQQQIRSCKDLIQVVLQVTVLCTQASEKKASAQVLPRLNEVWKEIQRLAYELNQGMSSSKNLTRTSAASEIGEVSMTLRKSHYESLSRHKDCLKSTASVIASTSTSLGQPIIATATTTNGSEFDAIFPPEPSEFTRSWVEESRISGNDEQAITLSHDGHLEITQGPLQFATHADSDYDFEIELEMAEALLQQGHEMLDEKMWQEAEQHLQDAVHILEENMPTQNSSETSTLWLVAISALIKTQQELQKWDNTKKLLQQKLAFRQRSSSGHDLPIEYFQDLLTLSAVLCENKEFREAQAQAKKAEKAFKDQGPSGIEGRKQALKLLIRICYNSGNTRPWVANGFSAILRQLSDDDASSAQSSLGSGREKLSRVSLGSSYAPPTYSSSISVENTPKSREGWFDTAQEMSGPRKIRHDSDGDIGFRYRNDSHDSQALDQIDEAKTTFTLANKSRKEREGAIPGELESSAIMFRSPSGNTSAASLKRPTEEQPEKKRELEVYDYTHETSDLVEEDDQKLRKKYLSEVELDVTRADKMDETTRCLPSILPKNEDSGLGNSPKARAVETTDAYPKGNTRKESAGIAHSSSVGPRRRWASNQQRIDLPAQEKRKTGVVFGDFRSSTSKLNGPTTWNPNQPKSDDRVDQATSGISSMQNPPTKKNPSAQKITLTKERVPAAERSIDELEERYDRIVRPRSEGLVHRDPGADAGSPKKLAPADELFQRMMEGKLVRKHRGASETSITGGYHPMTSRPVPARNSTSGIFAVLKSILR